MPEAPVPESVRDEDPVRPKVAITARTPPAPVQQALPLAESGWQFPPLSLLKSAPPRAQTGPSEEALQANARLLGCTWQGLEEVEGGDGLYQQRIMGNLKPAGAGMLYQIGSEETGLGVDIVEELGTIEYQFSRPAQGTRFDKTVHHFLMRPDGSGSVERHDREYDLVEWFPMEDALRSVTHRNEGIILRRAIETVEAMELTS